MNPEGPYDRRTESAAEVGSEAPVAGPAPSPGPPSTTPDFLLSHPTSSLRSQGVERALSDPDEASELLRSGTAKLVVGALPFDPAAPAALTVPGSVLRTRGPLEPPAYYRGRTFPTADISPVPSPAEHRRRVADAVSELRGPSELSKVVLARSLRLTTPEPINAPTLAARFIEFSPRGDGFMVDLSPAGPGFTGHRLIGSSPELLVRRRGDRVEAFPLAGSAPRTGDRATDRETADQLARSAKDLTEHAYVVDALRSQLESLCVTVDHPDHPEVTSTRTMLHLGTPVTAVLRDSRTTALDLARAVHPTPAVCGHPTSEAARWIGAHEEDRRFYGGAVGWCDSTGDGTWVVAIRCLELAADGTSATAWAGGGIVAASDPDAEYRETEAKFRTILDATGNAARH